MASMTLPCRRGSKERHCLRLNGKKEAELGALRARNPKRLVFGGIERWTLEVWRLCFTPAQDCTEAGRDCGGGQAACARAGKSASS